jgi:hypothetical protein
VFKDQGIISGQRHVEISRWFGEMESTFYKHPKSPHPDVFRVSNDRNEGCTGMIMSYTYISRNKKTSRKFSGLGQWASCCIVVTGLQELAAFMVMI